jgi:imidazolonepropionase-like amidohydrolase
MNAAMTTARLLFLSFACLPFFERAAFAQGSKATEAHCVLNGRIVTGTGEIIEKGRIVIRDGRIERIDTEATAPPDTRLFDATGLTVYPGFVDSSVVAGIVPDALKNEGPARDPSAEASARMADIQRKGIRPDASASQLLDIPEDVANGRRRAGFALAFFQPPAATIGGRGALAELSGLGRRDVLLKSDVAMLAELRPAAGEGYPGSMMGAIAQFRQALLDADWYRKAWKAYRERPAAMKLPPTDPVLSSLDPILDQSMPVAFEASTATQIRRAIQIAEEFQLKPWIVGGVEAHKVATLLASKQIPVLLSLDFGTEPKDTASRPAESRERPGRGRAGQGDRPESSPAPASEPATQPAPAATPWPNPDAPSRDSFLERKRRYDERVANAVVLHRAGVRIAFTTRGLGNPNDIHAAIVKLTEKGLPVSDALAALTTTPAALFGASEIAGSLAAGRPAYLTVTQGGLGEKDTKVRALFVGSRRFDFDDDAPSSAPQQGPGGFRRRPRGEGDERQSDSK